MTLSGTLATLALSAALTRGPADDLHSALVDCDQVPAVQQPSVRYLSLYHVPPLERDGVAAACSLALNLVSRGPSLVRPQRVGESLLRIDLAAYGIPPVVWEAMVSAGEPYWHLRTQALDPRTKQPATVYTDGGWVGLEDAARLRSLTGSGGAIVRADWFLAKSLTTVDGFYYELAGVGSQVNPVYAALGIDFVATERLTTEAWAILIRSGITLKARRVRQRKGAAGSAWKTEDTQDEVPQQDPIRVPLDTSHQASEHVLVKLNGLPLFLLADGQGKITRSAPDLVAKDTTDAHANGGILAPALSCLSCHEQNALQPLADDYQRLQAHQVQATFADPRDQQRADALFGRNLQRQLERDREDFGEAVLLACGVEYARIVPLAVRVYRAFVGPVSPAIAAAELSLPAGVALGDVLGASRDPILLNLCAGFSVNRKQFEASYAEAITLAEGWQP